MTIPKGYKLVPVETTEEMNEAACQGYMAADGSAWVMHKSSMEAAYRAMIQAAPSPPQPIYDESTERELFEVHYRKDFEESSGNELSDADIKSMRDGTWYGESRHYLNGQWAGWKARAKSVEVGHE